MDNKQIGALATLLGIVGFVIHHVPPLLLGKWVEGGTEAGLPMIGTTGQTFVIYNLLIDITTPSVMFALAIGLGYYIGQRVDVAEEYRQLVGITAIGSAVGGAVAGTAFLFEVSTTAEDTFAAFLLVGSTAAMVVPVALIITVGTLAGAALAHFRAGDDSPSHPTEVETEAAKHSDPTR